MSDDEYARIARELQAQPHPHGPQRTPPPWTALTAGSRAYWLAKARAGERPREIVEPPSVVQTPPRAQSRPA